MPVSTPSSTHSEYFDAPIAIFQHESDVPSDPMSSQDIPPSPRRKAYQLHDDGPQLKKPETQIFSTYDSQPQKSARMTTHPNGSEGWLPAVDDAPAHDEYSSQAKPSSRRGSPVKRGGSISPTPPRENAHRALPQSSTNGSIVHRRDTIRNGGSPTSTTRNSMSLTRSTSRKSNHTTNDGRIIPGSAFVNGAGATGPFAVAADDEDLAARSAGADAQLTKKQKAKISKSESKHNRQLSKIIKEEAKTEKKALGTAILELGELQKYQKQAVKSEARVQASHSKLLTSFKKTEAAYLHAKKVYETALAQLNAEAENLETLRNSAREATERMQDKSAEVDSLRSTLAVDDREREVKLGQLKGSTSRRGTLF